MYVHLNKKEKHQHLISLAFGVGLMHRLAGRGALIVIVMSQMHGLVDGLVYFTILEQAVLLE